MDRTEEIENFKKKLFSLQLKMAMAKDDEMLLNLSLEGQRIKRRIEALEDEIKNSNGQIGFAFTDLIEDTELKVKKGR